LGYFTDIWDILWPLGTFVFIWFLFPVLVSCTEKNLATLLSGCVERRIFNNAKLLLTQSSYYTPVGIFDVWLELRKTKPGWPDWANFRLLGDLFILSSSLKISKGGHIFVLLSTTVKVML
jgi:hypothetical protein